MCVFECLCVTPAGSQIHLFEHLLSLPSGSSTHTGSFKVKTLFTVEVCI